MTTINVPTVFQYSGGETYTIDENEVGRGGWGVVHRATDAQGRVVALKFFGYTNRAPERIEINNEIVLMMALHGVEGVIQFHGVFYDTVDGIIPGKRDYYRQPFPVIVMEPILGGTWYDQTKRLADASGALPERQHAVLFRRFILALRSIHARNFIHRDIKLANIMLENDHEDSPIKIIDFGYFVELSPTSPIFHSDNLVGTPGCYAPESLQQRHYSFKSDVWQAGVALFTVLCQHPPFYESALRQHDIINGTFYPSANYANLSDDAKDLLGRMLTVDPTQRISTDEILNHPWMLQA